MRLTPICTAGARRVENADSYPIARRCVCARLYMYSWLRQCERAIHLKQVSEHLSEGINQRKNTGLVLEPSLWRMSDGNTDDRGGEREKEKEGENKKMKRREKRSRSRRSDKEIMRMLH